MLLGSFKAGPAHKKVGRRAIRALSPECARPSASLIGIRSASSWRRRRSAGTLPPQWASRVGSALNALRPQIGRLVSAGQVDRQACPARGRTEAASGGDKFRRRPQRGAPLFDRRSIGSVFKSGRSVGARQTAHCARSIASASGAEWVAPTKAKSAASRRPNDGAAVAARLERTKRTGNRSAQQAWRNSCSGRG
jgi:hypothetical protein